MSGEVLTAEQLGHLRHWDNLSRRLPNDWSQMQGKGVSQDDFGGYRFQLAYMVYGLAITHRHRLPAAPGMFAPTIRRLIDKLLMPEVWLYWRDVSRGGSVFNAHLSGRLGEEWDPVVRDNIMYSAYVQSCAAMHDAMFDSDHYAEPGSLTFRHWSFFWGGEEKRFAYDRESLTEHLYWLMVETGYLGVACEPNCVFQICNQPAIIGFRLHDRITGGSRADEVVAGYERAWADFGRLDASGHYNMMVTEDSRVVRPNERPSPWVDAWCGALMNTWNRDFVRRHYHRQVADFLETGPGGTLSVPSAPARHVMGQEVVSDTCDLGWVAAWASEMGDEQTLAGLLAHADTWMSPTWFDGGLYYPRNDTHTDADGRRTEIEPMSGNVLLGYARLNVADGLRGVYQDQWPEGHFEAPRLEVVDRDIEVSRAEVVDGVLHARLRRDRTVPGDGTVTLAGLPTSARLRLGGTELTVRDGLVVDVPEGHAVDLVAAP
ncbi:hypothetical protein [Pseudonocardia sp. N23]|uniref:linalool dehydratase/isomerase domain-containing protein n=1 Tax=Pseudonocardia sp. N23 TaxID=1987376 RepID=UPI000BFD96DB|nr:hypothetical protein [Pseudonocardia sp. N23]GAY07388.1 hypothetical protein TOK_2613 [Pseudonocardia sp. N23]